MQESPMMEDAVKLKTARLVGWVVETVNRYTPWESKCLVQAVVGKLLLRQYGIANTLYFGVGRDEEKNLLPHAWLRSGEMMLIGGRCLERFTLVGKFADYGW